MPELNALVVVPEKLTGLYEDVGGVLEKLTTDLSGPEVSEAVLADYLSAVSRLGFRHESDSAAQAVLLNAHQVACGWFLQTGHEAWLPAVITSMSRPEDMALTIILMQKTALELDKDMSVVGSIGAKTFEELDRQRQGTTVEVLRYLRRITLESPLSPDSSNIYDAIGRQISTYVGADYDPIQDWAQFEASLAPGVDWTRLAAIARDDNLWPTEVTPAERMRKAQSTGRALNTIADEPPARGKVRDRVKSFMQKAQAEFSTTLADHYFDALIALAFYRHGDAVVARLTAKNIPDPPVVAYIARELLAGGDAQVAEAQRLLLLLPGGRDLIDLLLDDAWPDRSVPDKMLGQLVELQTKRSNNGKGPIISMHPIDMRLACINALADRRQEEGDDAEADLLRRRSELLSRQHARGIVKYIPPRKR